MTSWPRPRQPTVAGLPTSRGRSSDEPRLTTLQFPFALEEAKLSALDNQTIHLWRAFSSSGAGTDDPVAAQFVRLLSSQETARMLRFHFAHDQSAFAFARGMLRTLLGSYLGVSPELLCFQSSDLGKPSLSGEWAQSSLHFNLSHTAGAVVLAVCRDREIGADIEHVRQDFDVEDIAGKFFSPSEQQALLSFAPGQSRVEAFFRCWTRKEAWLKARGSGLSFPLTDFDVSMSAEEGEVLLVTRPDPDEARRWRILDKGAPGGYASAVAFAQPEERSAPDS
jgi:4'-phosphopantetheinyl transferase